MKITYGEAAVGFFALAYLSGRAVCDAVSLIHGFPLAILSSMIAVYAAVRGVWCGWTYLTKEVKW